MRRLVLALLLLPLVFGACDKAATQQCDLGCRNYFLLHYWQTAEFEINAAPAEERAALRAKKQSELEERMMQNLDLCITKCKSGATKQRVQCWIDAKTAQEAERCKSE
jgi:hypothetical protein